MDDETVNDEIGRGGISRRDIFKAGAVVGGAVWVAPGIDSFASRAAAGSLPPGGCTGCTGYLGGPVICGSSNGAGCSCFTTTEDTCACTSGIAPSGNQCTSSTECVSTWGPGYVCVTQPGEASVCAIPC